MTRISTASLLIALVLLCPAVHAQTQPLLPPAPAPSQNPFAGGVPSGERTATPLSLTLADALARGLQHNLGVLNAEESVAGARGARWQALEAVLPNISGRLGADREVVNLAALGFTGFPGIPQVIGPFNVYDARVSVSQPIIDPSGLLHLRETGQLVKAAEHGYRNARDLVVLAVSNLYLQALSAESRVGAARAQLDTAAALARLAEDRKNSGLVAGIDVLRAQVELETGRHRLIAAENSAAKQKLALSRAIGLPIGQEVALSDPMPDAVSTEIPTVDAAVQQAYAHREDLKGLEAVVAAAESAAAAASAERLPTVAVDANWGAIGETPSAALPTYTVAANVRVPLFNAGATKARSIEAGATLRRRKAELDDARGRVFYEISAAVLDLNAAQQQVDVATRAVALAEEQLTQARDRFNAGVADTIEVVQAQESVATAHDAQIGSLYNASAARAALAAAQGLAEEQMLTFLGVTR